MGILSYWLKRVNPFILCLALFCLPLMGQEVQPIQRGPIASRPASPAFGRLYIVTDTGAERLTYFDGSHWQDVTINAAYVSGGAPKDATYITQTPNAILTNEQALSALTTGLLKSTTGTGVVSIATAGTDYEVPLTFSTGLNRTVNTVTNTGVLSVTGDGALITNSGSTGAVTLAVGSAAAHKFWGNNTGLSATASFEQLACADLSDAGTLCSSSSAGITQLTGDVLAGPGSGSQSAMVVKVDGVSYPASPSTNTVPVVTGSNTVTYEAVPNAALANNSITINGTSVSLGGTRSLVLNSSDFANEGTTTTVLHGNAAGNPSFGAVVSADLSITTTTCTNQFIRSLSSGAVGTCATVTNSDLSSATITLNSGTNFGITAPGSMALGSTNTIGSTSDNLRFNALGLGTAAPTGAGMIANAQGTITSDAQGLLTTVTWNSSSTAFTAWKLSVTNTASSASSKLIDLVVGSTSIFKLDLSGSDGSTGTFNGDLSAPNGIITGFNTVATGHLRISSGSAVDITSSGYNINGGYYGFNGTNAVSAPDVAFRRNSSTAIEIDSGTAGAYRDLALRKELFEGTSSGVVTVTGAATAGTWTFTLPTSGGTANYAMTTDGSGTASWVSGQSIAGLTTSDTPQFARLGLGAAADGTYLLNLNGGKLIGTSVGFASGTTAPDVGGYGGFYPTLTLQGTSRGVLELVTSASDAAGNTAGGIVFTASNNTAGGADKKVALIQSSTRGTTTNNRGGDLAFYTKADGGALTQNFTINQNGSITFDAVGPHGIGADFQVDAQLYMAGHLTTPTGGVFGAGEVMRVATEVNIPAGFEGRGLILAPTLDKAGSGTHSLFSSLYVAPPSIGAGASTLTSAATVYISGAPSSGTNKYALWVAAGRTQLDGTVFVPNVTTASAATSADACFSSGELVNDTALCVVSARRFKNTIEDSDIGLDMVKQLRPVSYYLNENPERGQQFGFIAEEVENIDRRFVTYQKDGQIRSVLYIELIPILTRAIQQLESRVKELESK